MKVVETAIPDVLIIEPKVFGDERGFFYESFNAAAFEAAKLIFLTDVDGVRDGAGVTRPVLTVAECRDLIAAEVATGGMRAKLDAAILGIEKGVGEVVIAPGARAGIVPELLAGVAVGTRIVAA